MNRIKKLALFLIVSLAFAATTSCTTDGSDDDQTQSSSSGESEGGSSSSGSETSEQVYLNNEDYEYAGNASVVIFDYASKDTLSAGAIKNGKITLKLPASIDSKYFMEKDKVPEEFCDIADSYITVCESSKNTLGGAYIYEVDFKAYVPGKGLCGLSLEIKKDDAWYDRRYYYTTKAGELQAFLGFSSSAYSANANYDWNMEKGLNVVYEKSNDLSNGEKNIKTSTDISTLEGIEPVWILDDNHCDDEF